MPVDHISICICTYQRPIWLKRLLSSIQMLETAELFTYSVVVADNDPDSSARSLVAEFSESSLNIKYVVEPLKGFAKIRNAVVTAASGEWIAFIDDDEYPERDWLLNAYRAIEKFGCSGVLGPVRPHFEAGAPDWVKKCSLYHRSEHVTGRKLEWRECRTGNVLFKRGIIIDLEEPFDDRFQTGGEDQDFFRRMMDSGYTFVWCNEAVVHETVPPVRWDISVLCKRALLRGGNTVKHGDVGLFELLKSCIAIAAYGLVLPVFAVVAWHRYVAYLVSLCDHLGKLMAKLGFRTIVTREG